MAKQLKKNTRKTLQDAPQLHSFIIPNVKPTGRQLGAGSYGSVEELEIDGLVCAGKKLYDALIDPQNQDAQRMVARFYEECRLLCDLRHPHIVQFLGICFLPDFHLPVLVIERMESSLDEILESTADIPLSTKVSILQDVARGLVYLHNHHPPVIHRDLTARNILLNSAMTAKIADLGNSRMANLLPGQLAMSMSQGIPGTLVYMPPEVSDGNNKYGPSLDMFSFGHLALFTAIRTFPGDLLPTTYQDDSRKKCRNELERRGRYIDKLHERFEGKNLLVVLIKGCLDDKPVKRPSARQALEMLEEMKTTLNDPHSNLSRLQLVTSLTKKEAEVQQIPTLRSEMKKFIVQKERLEEAYMAKDELLTVREREIQLIPVLQTTLEQLNVEKARLEAVCRKKNALLEASALKLAATEKALSDEKLHVSSLTSEYVRLGSELEQLTLENLRLDEMSKQKDEMITAKVLEIAAMEKALSVERQQVSSLADEYATLKGRIEGNMEEIKSLQSRNRTLQEENTAKNEVIKAKEFEILEKDRCLVTLQEKCGSLQTQLEKLQKRNQYLEVDMSGVQEVCKGKDEVIKAREQEITAKERNLLEERQRVSSLLDEYATLKGRLEGKTEEIESLQAQIRTVQEETACKDKVISAKDSEILEKDQQFVSLQQRCGSLQTQLETLQRRNQSLEARYSTSEDLLAVKDVQIAALHGGIHKILQTKAPQIPRILTFNLPLKWNEPIQMPSGVCDAHAVVIGGKMYIGGGVMEGGNYKVLEYSVQECLWNEIETPVQRFGMAVIDSQLIIIGGVDREWSATNEVWVLDNKFGSWTQPFPAMSTARYWPSAVGYNRWVLVVGGRGKRSVEVLDTASKQWYIATSLPSNAYRPSLSVTTDILYVVWGCSAVSIYLPVMISDATSKSSANDKHKPIEWQTLPETPSENPTITALHGSLIAMGGDPVSSAIAMLLPHTKQWHKVAELPFPCRSCTCAILVDTEKLIVIGGEDKNRRYNKCINICTF